MAGRPRRMPSRELIDEIKEIGCDRRACWVHDCFPDGGVLAKLGNGWWCFRADRHFSNANRCLRNQDGREGFCDGIAVFAQTSNRTCRVLELKTPVDFAEAKDPLRCGVEFALRLPSVVPECVRAELHVRDAPETTIRPSARSRTLVVGTRAFEIHLYVDGEVVLGNG